MFGNNIEQVLNAALAARASGCRDLQLVSLRDTVSFHHPTFDGLRVSQCAGGFGGVCQASDRAGHQWPHHQGRWGLYHPARSIRRRFLAARFRTVRLRAPARVLSPKAIRNARADRADAPVALIYQDLASRAIAAVEDGRARAGGISLGERQRDGGLPAVQGDRRLREHVRRDGGAYLTSAARLPQLPRSWLSGGVQAVHAGQRVARAAGAGRHLHLHRQCQPHPHQKVVLGEYARPACRHNAIFRSRIFVSTKACRTSARTARR